MGGRILIVDDDLLVSWFLADMLEDLGFDSCEASTAGQAVELIRNDAGIEMMLTDLHMPGTNGYELSEQVRRLRPELPVVLVTGDGAAVDNDHNQLVLAKPYTSQQLDDVIKHARLVPLH